MSTPSKTTTPIKKGHVTDDHLGMSASEIRLLLLASVVQDKDGKPDAEKIAKMCNLTVGSTKVLIPKARRKLIANIDDGYTPSKSPAAKPVSAKPAKPAPADPTTPKAKAPAAKRPRKRKAEPKDDDEPKFEALTRADSSEPEQQQQQALEHSLDEI